MSDLRAPRPRPRPGTWMRIAIVLAYAVALGLREYAGLTSIDFWGLDGVRRVAHTTAAELGFALALPILVGFVVRRWWALAALAGPLLSLGYARTSGERGFDGGDPLTSPSGISGFFWAGLFLLIGVGAGWAWERLRSGGGDAAPTPRPPG